MARIELLESGTVWAWREGKRDAYTAVRIQELSNGYTVWCEQVDAPGSQFLAKAVHLRCEWERLDEFLEDYRWLDARLRSAQRGEPFGPWSPPWERRSSARTPSASSTPSVAERSRPRVVYSLQAAADECGVSAQFLRGYVQRNDLVAHYAGSKMLILADDLRDWVARLPFERE